MIVVEQICKSFGNTKAVDSVSFEINDGQSLVLAGPSGSGKSTLLRLIAGLEIPDHGRILFDSRLASAPGYILEPHLRNIGFVFQRPALWPHMTVAQNILFGMNHLPRGEASSRLSKLLSAAGLDGLAKRRPDEISEGQARRVAILRALAPNPKYLLMDEPLTNLDPELKLAMLQLIRSSVETTGATLIFVTHDEHEATGIGGPIVRLNAGRLEAGSS